MNIILIPHLPTLYGRRYNLAKTLAQQGHAVHYIVWDMPYPLSAQRLWRHLKTSLTAYTTKDLAGFTVHKVRRLPLFWPFVNGWLFKYQIKKLYRRQNVDVVLSQSFTNETEPPLNLPLIYDMNDDHAAFATAYGSRIYKLAHRLLTVKRVIRRQAEHACIVTVVSDRLLCMAKHYNRDVIKISNGVEAAALKTRRVTTQKHTIAYVSTFGKWAQGVDTIRMIKKLARQLPDIHLDCIGEGTELAAMRREVAKLRLKKHVTIHGRIDNRDQLFDMVARADVCLNVSDKNAFRDAASPLKVLDYTALGKKVVSTDLDEVVALGFPNIYTYTATTGMGGFEKALLQAFAANRSTTAVKQEIRRTYTWDALVTKMLTFLEANR
jgi:glycosyltransferase involved in cell wall biosynthesis